MEVIFIVYCIKSEIKQIQLYQKVLENKNKNKAIKINKWNKIFVDIENIPFS